MSSAISRSTWAAVAVAALRGDPASDGHVTLIDATPVLADSVRAGHAAGDHEAGIAQSAQAAGAMRPGRSDRRRRSVSRLA